MSTNETAITARIDALLSQLDALSIGDAVNACDVMDEADALLRDPFRDRERMAMVKARLLREWSAPAGHSDLLLAIVRIGTDACRESDEAYGRWQQRVAS